MENNWILVEDRLPVVYKAKCYSDWVIVCDKEGDVGIGRIFEFSDYKCWMGNFTFELVEYELDNIVAWQPLPEPYEGGE